MGAAAIIGIVILLILIVVGGIYASKSSSSTSSKTPPPQTVVPKPATGTPAQYASNPATTSATKPPPESQPVIVKPPASPPAIVTPSAPVNQSPAPTTPTASSVVTTPPPVVATPPPVNWQYVNGIYVPVALTAADGDIECLSTNAKDCMWQTDEASTKKLLANIPSPNSPLVCGDMHKKLYGDKGYDTPDHWCNKAMKQLNPTSSKLPPTTISTPFATAIVTTPPTTPPPTTPSGPSYKFTANYDAAGNDIECLHGVTPDVCKAKCDNDANCLAYNEVKKGIWGPNDFGCCTKKAIVNLQPINNIDFYSKNVSASTKVYSRIPLVDGGYNDGQFGDKPLKKGYYDVLGQGVPNDYCRYVGDQPNIFFACQLSD